MIKIKNGIRPKLKKYLRVCLRCSEIYTTPGKYSKVCEKCRRKRGKKGKNENNI